MDVLSDVLNAVRLTGAVYFDVRARCPWVAETPATSRICQRVMPEFEHVIAFHIMLDGWCWAQLADESQPPVRLESGDAVIFPEGEGHFMGTERGKRALLVVYVGCGVARLFQRETDRNGRSQGIGDAGVPEKRWFLPHARRVARGSDRQCRRAPSGRPQSARSTGAAASARAVRPRCPPTAR